MNNWVEAVKKPLEMITGRHAGARPEESGAELVKPEQLQPRRAEPSSVARRAAKGSKARDILGPAQKKAGYLVGDELDGKAPEGDPLTAWTRRQSEYKLVNPANRRKMNVIVVGTGLSGSGVAATLGQLGYHVDVFCFHDSPRRAHSVAAQGGINAARARKVDGDSLKRFVKDTVKGGDYRGREADVVRLGTESVRVIDHMYAIGAPFAREYGGQLATRSFGGVQVSRTYYTRGETG